MNGVKLVIASISVVIIISCNPRKTELVWEQNFSLIGSQSSPRPIDINHDGIDDIVMGACKNEYIPNEQGVIALDGKTGTILWQSDAPDQVYGSPTLIDISGDHNKDIIISGRWSYLRAINGQSGKTIWNYTYSDSLDPVLKYAKFNFYNNVLVPDQNGDGIEDILIQNGGNHKAAPTDSVHRYPGVLMLIDSKTGKVIAADTMPDGRESYMSPVYYKTPDGKDFIVFGSGGETFRGHLFVTELENLRNKKLNLAHIIATERVNHGFIGPPVIADFNHDGYPDIAAISHSSHITVTDGKTFTAIWEKQLPNTESSNSFAVGQFTGDDTPDLFTFASKGVWPQSTGSVQVMLDGKNGNIVYIDSIGCAGFSSPVAYDLNGDGIDEVILSTNDYNCGRGYIDYSHLDITNKLIAIDFKNHQVQTIDESKKFKNIYSTPLICDLDHDGYLDIIYNQFYSADNDLLAFLGMRTRRIQTGIKMNKPVRWGSYMGSNGNGIY